MKLMEDLETSGKDINELIGQMEIEEVGFLQWRPRLCTTCRLVTLIVLTSHSVSMTFFVLR
jgi:hypothetical protein